VGYSIYEKHGSSQRKVILQSMRTMARFLQAVQDVSNQTVSLEAMIAPDKFDTVVAAVHSLAQQSVSARRYPKYDLPPVALKVGNYLMSCKGILKGKALRTCNTNLERQVSNFVNLYISCSFYRLEVVTLVCSEKQSFLPDVSQCESFEVQ